jgi:hypothetical protein
VGWEEESEWWVIESVTEMVEMAGERSSSTRVVVIEVGGLKGYMWRLPSGLG